MDTLSSSSSVDHHPDKIIELILSRCPAESVGRFTSVSKSWHSIISNPRFRRLHYIQQSKLPQNQNMFLTFKSALGDGLPEPIFYVLKDGEFQSVYVTDDPCNGFYPLSSCDGLILVEDDKENYMLWNPLIEKYIIIPAFTPKSHPRAFTNRPHDRPHWWLRHLYFDSISNGYKILVAYENWYTLYSCHNGIWGEIKDIPDDLLDVDYHTTCVDGCIYDEPYKGEIICFDTRDGKLHKFPLPNIDVEGFVLTDISGRVCLKKRSEDGRRLHLWVMEKNIGSLDKSWKKLISMEKEERDLRDLNVECLTNEDDVLLSAWSEEEDFIYKYSARENCFQKIRSDWNRYYHHDSNFPYSENLCMPSPNTVF